MSPSRRHTGAMAAARGARGERRAARRRPSRRAARSLVGRDLAPARWLVPRERRTLPLLVAGVVLAALALAALRIDLIRVRYGLAEAVSEQKALLEERRTLVARVRTLRDPARLARLARERGFVQPERVIELVSSEDRP